MSRLASSLLLLVGYAIIVSGSSVTEQDLDSSWGEWKAHHVKVYEGDAEEMRRRRIWEENLKLISYHNLDESFGKHSYRLAMNQFGDMTTSEFRNQIIGYGSRNETKSRGSTFLALSNVQIPDSVDWRTEGYVTPVKNQGQCGSDWAFSTTGSLEGQTFKKTGKLVSLSEQNLIDCSTSYGNHGCQGGLMDNAFKYIKANGGIDSETCYPYHAKNEKCHYKPSCASAVDTGHVDITSGDEAALKQATATVGPISVAIDASHFSFQFYHSGVYDESSCSTTALDRGVLVVGYGAYNGKDYWLVKNSWGIGWGLKGYIRMSRNKNNQCGIASKASYPLV